MGQLCLDTPSILGVAELNGNDFIVRDFNSCVGQHEMSHLYGCYDHDLGLWTWCVMSYTWGYYVRSWCGTCTDIINNNLYRW